MTDAPIPQKKLYATQIIGRSPKFKIHNTLGQAHAAMNCVQHMLPREATLFELQGNEWVAIESYVPNFNCIVCNLPVAFRNGRIVNYKIKPNTSHRLIHDKCKVD